MRENGIIFINDAQSIRVRKKFIDASMNRRRFGQKKVAKKKNLI